VIASGTPIASHRLIRFGTFRYIHLHEGPPWYQYLQPIHLEHQVRSHRSDTHGLVLPAQQCRAPVSQRIWLRALPAGDTGYSATVRAGHFSRGIALNAAGGARIGTCPAWWHPLVRLVPAARAPRTASVRWHTPFGQRTQSCEPGLG
jgi:hypothetical protein